MKEYKVEFTQVNKKYACVTVMAESKKEAIDMVRNAKYSLEDYDDNETATQSQWIASSERGLIGWLSSFFKGS